MIVGFLARFLLLGAYVLVPGAAFLMAVRFRFTNWLDGGIACIAAGLAWTSACVYGLLFLNLYTPLTAVLILLVPAAWLMWTKIQGFERRPTTAVDSGDRLSLLDRLVAACVVVFLISTLVDAATSPVTVWDGDVTWDKWATDWARRQNLYGYLLGGYPQLLPMFSSVLYKLAGTYHLAIPLEQYVLHAGHVTIAFVLLFAILRLCRALELPAWPAVALTFGNSAITTGITNGSADLLLTALTLCAAALLVTFIRGNWDSRYGVVPVLSMALFGACFAKANGLLVLLYPVSYYLLQRLWRHERGSLRGLTRTSLALVLLLPTVAVAPFYVYQFAQSQNGVPAYLNPHEVNFQTGTMLSRLQTISDQSFGQRGTGTRMGDAVRRIAASAEVPADWLNASTVCAVVLFLASLRRRLALPLVFPTLVVAAIWYRVTFYDLRNLLPVLPIAAVLATAGAMEIRSLLGRSRPIVAIVVACSAMLAVFSGRVFLVRAAATATMLRQSPSTAVEASLFSRRLAAMQGDADERIRMFFPSEWPTYSWVRSLGPSAPAQHIIATAHMYRWFQAGSYPASLWDPSRVRPGDFYIGSPPWRPPAEDQWTLLRDADGFKVWILDVNPQIVEPTEFRQDFIGRQIEDRSLSAGSSIVWQAIIDARDLTPGVRAGFRVSDAATVDEERTGLAVETIPGNQQVAALSGILTLSGKTPPGQGILVGIERGGTNTPLRLHRFRVSIYK